MDTGDDKIMEFNGNKQHSCRQAFNEAVVSGISPADQEKQLTAQTSRPNNAPKFK